MTSSNPADPLLTPDRLALRDDLMAVFVAHNRAARAAPTAWPEVRLTDARFAALARRVIRHQLTHNAALARYARRMGCTLDALGDDFDPFDVPPLPTDAFKRAHLAVFEPAEAVATFRSSGTTEADRGRHPFATLALTRAAAAAWFSTWFVPDRTHLRVLALMPRHRELPDSSLAFMLDDVVRTGWGDADSQHLVHPDTGLDLDAARAALESAALADEPVLLCGPSFAYVHLLDGLADDWRVELPAGSRLFETGGFKGRSREVPRDALHAALIDRLGLEPAMIAGEYGMSELSSQLYEPTVRHRLAGEPMAPRLYIAPPWCGVRVVDPVDLQPVPVGESGQVALLDLANLDSVAHVITGDLGRLVPLPGAPGSHGLELHGRAADAAPKGCSMAIDALLGG